MSGAAMARPQGDGCSSSEETNSCEYNKGEAGNKAASKPRAWPFSLQVELDLLQLLLFVVAMVTRFYGLNVPMAVVFDELHYGRFATMYLHQTFFFDTQPPLGKLLLALPAWLVGYTGNFSVTKIGQAYPVDVPVWGMRAVPAMFGSLLVPMVYQLLVLLGLSRWAAATGALLVIADNALLTQSRLMHMESVLLFFMISALVCFLKFRCFTYRPFSSPWWTWMVLCGVSCAFAVSVKYIGAMTLLLILVLMVKDYWLILPDWSYSDKNMLCQFLARVLCMVVLPVGVYLGIFCFHLSILHRAGPHDDVMSSAFQASLQGGLASITKGQPLHVAYGSQITLRHAHGMPCWLHSHKHVYPVRYEDTRGSSHQQQVTCYTYKDVNNWWIVKDPNKNTVMVDDPVRPVRHGDLIQLVHGLTTRALNSHDVAAPMSPQNQEVSCYINYNVSMPPQSLWRLEVLNPDQDDLTWRTIQSQVRLVHVNTSQALKVSGRQLPEWGFYQLEVVADRIIDQEATVWNVEEHRYTHSEDDKDRTRELNQAEMIPTEPTQLSLWAKFAELQWKMLTVQRDSPSEHRYSSHPIEWPLSDINVAYWADLRTGAQIHLLGNPLLWTTGCCCLILTSGVLIFHILRRRRKCYDVSQASWQQYRDTCELLLGGYAAHYLPFWLTEKTLFLHHYLPALMFKLMLIPALLHHAFCATSWPSIHNLLVMVTLAWLTSILQAFHRFSVLSYGHQPLSVVQLTTLAWWDTWDFIKPS